MKYWTAFSLILLILVLVPQLFIVKASLNSTPIEERKTGRRYPVEVVSKKVLETRIENGEVTTFYEYTVRTSRETLIKMINEDWETYEDIKYSRGQSAADEWRSKQLEVMKNAPEYVESKIKVVKHGEKCITYGSMLCSMIWPWIVENDPVNINFVEDGSAGNVFSHMIYDLDTLWYSAIGSGLYGFIDNTANGGSSEWKTQDSQVDYPPGAWYIRNHTRLYDGGYDSHQFGYWSMGGVHHEHWNWWPPPCGHIVVDWDDIRDSLATDFEDESFVSDVEFIDEGNQGWPQGVETDGYSARIWLTD